MIELLLIFLVFAIIGYFLKKFIRKEIEDYEDYYDDDYFYGDEDDD